MVDETIPCEICGDSTTYTGTRRCNSCWEMERGFELLRRKPDKARRWLTDKLAEIRPLPPVLGKGSTK